MMADTSCDDNTEFNLERFLGNLTLEPMVHGKRAPPMPPLKGRSTLTPLVVRSSGMRKLKTIQTLTALEDEATSFFNNLNASMGDGARFKALKLASQLPSKDMEKLFFGNPYEVEAISGVLFVIERGPIKSVQQLVKMIDPQLRDLNFFTPARNGTLDAQKIEPIYFCTMNDTGGMGSVKCTVIALPPWDFTPQDFKDFTKMETFVDGSKSVNRMRNDRPWNNADRMWAYFHDLCFMHDCHHFVLTSYEQWAFGAFSILYTTGFVSKVIPWDAKPMSVLELFTYWVLDACRTEDTVMMEQVPTGDSDLGYDVLGWERYRHSRQIAQDEALMGAEISSTAHQMRPHKGALKDPLEDRMGWEPLGKHADAFSASLQKLHPSKPITFPNLEQRSNLDDNNMFAKPYSKWNFWHMCKPEVSGKKTPPIDFKTNERKDKPFDQTTKLPTRPQFSHPIPCFSLDVDRNNDCFRPEPIGFPPFPNMITST